MFACYQSKTLRYSLNLATSSIPLSHHNIKMRGGAKRPNAENTFKNYHCDFFLSIVIELCIISISHEPHPCKLIIVI